MVTATGAGPPGDARERAQVLEESLDVIIGLWSGEPLTHRGPHFEADDARLVPTPLRRERVPIWVGGALTKAGPRARALRWDGACLYRVPPPDWDDITPDDVRSLRHDAGRDDFVICVGGRERHADLAAERRYVADLADGRRRLVAGVRPAAVVPDRGPSPHRGGPDPPLTVQPDLPASCSFLRSSRSITGFASTPCTMTDATMVNATVDQSQSSPSSSAWPAAYAR